MIDPTRVLRNTLGKGLNVPRFMHGPSRKDFDGDGIPNKRDCQPFNISRQDPPRYEYYELFEDEKPAGLFYSVSKKELSQRTNKSPDSFKFVPGEDVRSKYDYEKMMEARARYKKQHKDEVQQKRVKGQRI